MQVKPEVERATIKDVLITRDEQGQIIPIDIHSDILNRTVSLRPMTYGWVKRNNANTDIPARDWDLDLKLKCIKDHYVEPDFGDVTIKDIEDNTDPMTINHLIALIVTHSIPFFRIHQKERSIPALVDRMKVLLAGIDSPKLKDSSIKLDTDIQE